MKKQNSTTTSSEEIMAAAKIIQILLRMEAGIVAEKGSLVIPPETTFEIIPEEEYVPAL